MKRAESLKELKIKFDITEVVLACGVFDGVHLGHQKVLDELKQTAQANNATPVVLTFDPHPQAVLRFDMGPPRLTTTEQKIELLHRYGAEATVILRFSEELADLSADEFLARYILIPEINLHGICIGSDWRFGKNAEGDAAYLHRKGQSHDFIVKTIPPFTTSGRPVSSTRVRKCIAQGGLSEAENLLGRPYAVRGKVEKGRQAGASILGCPTANLTIRELLLPPPGVYAGKGRIPAGDSPIADCGRHPGIIYIGDAPSFQDKPGTEEQETANVEFHFFDLNQDLYGQCIEVEFHDFIRRQKTFRSPADLSKQIKADIQKAEELIMEK